MSPLWVSYRSMTSRFCLLLLLNWFLHIIKRTLHVGSKLWILCSSGKNNISRVSEANEIAGNSLFRSEIILKNIINQQFVNPTQLTFCGSQSPYAKRASRAHLCMKSVRWRIPLEPVHLCNEVQTLVFDFQSFTARKLIFKHPFWRYRHCVQNQSHERS